MLHTLRPRLRPIAVAPSSSSIRQSFSTNLNIPLLSAHGSKRIYCSTGQFQAARRLSIPGDRRNNTIATGGSRRHLSGLSWRDSASSSLCLDVVHAQRRSMKSGEIAFYILLEPKISIAGAGIGPANCCQERPGWRVVIGLHPPTTSISLNRPPSSDNIANQAYRIARDVQAPGVFDADWFKIASLRPSSRTIHARHNDKPHDLVAAGFVAQGSLATRMDIQI